MVCMMIADEKPQPQLLSKKAACNTHGQDSSYFLGWEEYEKNPYDPVANPGGIIKMGLAENNLSFDLLEANPEALGLRRGGASVFRELALCPDYHGMPAFKNVNGPGKSIEGRNINQEMAQGLWANTSGLDCAELGKPIDLVPLQHSWQAYMGQPMVQKVPGTCVLVACIVCLQAVHRIEYEKLHGERDFQFSCHCMAMALHNRLFNKCKADNTWVSGRGANVGEVLNKIQQMEGLPATNTPTLAQRVLPLRSWDMHRWDDCHGRGLSPERVAKLLYNNGPCVGLLWVTPSYHHVDADRDDTVVYTTSGCGRGDDAKRRSFERHYPGQVGWHAVVCFGYRFRGEQIHVVVLDNHTPTGPRRWIDVEELNTVYTLTVL